MLLRTSVVFALGALILAASLVGCGGNEEVSKPQQQSRLKALALLYGRFTGQHRGQPPKDEAEFKEFVKGIGTINSADVKSPEELFVSERDGQPYVILYGAQVATAKKLNGQPVMGYEQKGANGKRFIANSLGQVDDLDEAKFKELVP